MGKGKGKASKRAEKTAKKTAKKAAKREAREAAGVAPRPRPARDGDGEHKSMRKKKPVRPLLSGGLNLEDLPELPTPAAKAAEALKHVKWTALFKKHIGILESHVKALDRVMQSLKAFMANLEPTERELWECGEKGNWKNICGLMDRAREAVVSARIAATGMLPPGFLRDKKTLGIHGLTFVPMLPKVEQRARELGRDPNAKYTMPNGIGTTNNSGNRKMENGLGSSGDSDSDASSSDESEADSDAASDQSSDSESEASGERGTEEDHSTEAGGNQYFVIDTNPTPVDLNGDAAENKKSKKRVRTSDEGESIKKTKKSKKEKHIAETTGLVPEPETSTSEVATLGEEGPTNGSDAKADKISKKKRAKGEDSEDKKSKKSKKSKAAAEDAEPTELNTSTVDFTAIQAKLQEEVDEGMRAKEAQALIAEAAEKKDKKRRRSSDGEEKLGKKAKKEKEGKENKKEKKVKKRKADEEEEVVEVEIKEKKKKRKEA